MWIVSWTGKSVERLQAYIQRIPLLFHVYYMGIIWEDVYVIIIICIYYKVSFFFHVYFKKSHFVM